MKALTICQPYAALICLPDDHDRAKRVENRTWPTSYRGPLLIHAGKSREWIKKFTTPELKAMKLESCEFGAIVGICQLRDCVQMSRGTLTVGMMVVNGVEIMPPGTTVIKAFPDSVNRRWPWLEQHEHTEGPWCWILQECHRFDKPIPYRGAQGLFNVPNEIVAEQMAALVVGCAGS